MSKVQSTVPVVLVPSMIVSFSSAVNNSERSAGAPLSLPLGVTTIADTETTSVVSTSSILNDPVVESAALPSGIISPTSVIAVTVGASFVPVTVTVAVAGAETPPSLSVTV